MERFILEVSPMTNYRCCVCDKEFKSYNPNPKYCSRSCKDENQRAEIDIDKAIELYESGLTQLQVAERFGYTQRAVFKLFKKAGYKSRGLGKRNQEGENNDNWNGGKTKHKGYVLVRNPEHPRASNGYVYEHILVMEKHLGRYLAWKEHGHPDNEIIHHKNKNRKDNRLSNLVLTTPAEHLNIHRNKKGQNGG
jgi:HNH endonuclease